jgi:NADPH:quinone reductase-like Zn-dependent oxidoreductase
MGLLPNFITKRPHVAEHDFAGIVINGNGTRFKNGQEVYGQTGVGKQNLF